MTISEKTDVYRVLVVDDDPTLLESMRRTMQFETDLEVVAVAMSGREGVQMAVEHDPHVIIMDVNMPDLDGLDATEQIKARVPLCEIVILSIHRDAHYMRKAMKVGARDYLAKPPNVEELLTVVRTAAQLSAEARQEEARVKSEPKLKAITSFGRIVSIYSPKGGTGCTTIASNLGVTLHNAENPVTLLDADLQGGDVSFFFNEQGRNSIADLAPRADVLDMNIVEDVMIQHDASGVNILAAPTHPEEADVVSREQYRMVLEYLSKAYPYVIIDTSSHLDDITVSTFDMSDVITLIVTQEIPSIRKAHIFYELMEKLGIDRNRILLVINKYDRRINITPEQIKASLKEDDAVVVPLDERFVLPAMNRGEPFMINNKTHPVAKGMLSLAESVRERIEMLERAEIEGAEGVDRLRFKG